MSAQKQQPFQFDEFNKQVEQESETAFSESDLERAEREGFEKGKLAALGSLEATKTDAIKRIADAVEATKMNYSASFSEVRSQDLEAIRSFLHEYFAETALKTTIDDITNAIQQIASKSGNGIALTIKLNPVSFEREGEVLHSRLKRSSIANSVSVETCEKIKKGDFEISWVDGALVSESEQSAKAVNDLLDRLKHLGPNGDAE